MKLGQVLVSLVTALVLFWGSSTAWPYDPNNPTNNNPDQDTLLAVLHGYMTNHGVTMEQARAWFYAKQAEERELPRVFPWCFNLDKTKYTLPPELEDFRAAMEESAKLRAYDPLIWGPQAYHDMTGKYKGTTKLVDNLFIYKIEVHYPDGGPLAGTEPDTEQNPNNRHVLKQWANVRLQLPINPVITRYLMVQVISAPLGVPIGELLTVFDPVAVYTTTSANGIIKQGEKIKCNQGYDVYKDPGDYTTATSVVPCHFAPRTAYTWPNVFVMKYPPGGPNPPDFIQFRFRWTQTHCHETGYFQFLIIAGKDTNSEMQFVLSRTHRIIFESEDAVPYPYHPFHEAVDCGLNHKNYGWSNDRIIANKEYDDCVIDGTAGSSGADKDRCPPGPLKCDGKEWTNSAEWTIMSRRWKTDLIVEPVTKCCEFQVPLPPPEDPPTTTTTTTTTSTTTTTTTPSPTTSTTSKTTTPSTILPKKPSTTTTTLGPVQKQQAEQEKYLRDRTLRFEMKYQISHGDFCILIWLIVVPTADLFARFFKDFPDTKIGLGMWIVIHMALHVGGLMMAWWSFGLIIGGDGEPLNVNNRAFRHYIAGIITAVFFHIQFITGLKRMERAESKRFNWVLNHAAQGYFSHLLGIASVFFSSAGQERLWISAGLFGIWFVTLIALHITEKRQDRFLEVFYRAQCPVLQRIMIEEGNPPYAKSKIAIIVISICLQLGLYIYMLVAYSAEEVARARLGQ